MKKIAALVLCVIICFSSCASEAVFAPARGELADGLFENRAFGISFSYEPEKWQFLSDEETSEVYGRAYEEMYPDGEGISQDYIYDVYGYNADGACLSITYENLGDKAAGISEKDYIDFAVSSVNEYAQAATAESTVAEGGLVYTDISILMDDEMTFERMAVKKVDTWMAVVVVSSRNKDDIEIVFSSLKG